MYIYPIHTIALRKLLSWGLYSSMSSQRWFVVSKEDFCCGARSNGRTSFTILRLKSRMSTWPYAALEQWSKGTNVERG
jgi:hypothetical protein